MSTLNLKTHFRPPSEEHFSKDYSLFWILEVQKFVDELVLSLETDLTRYLVYF